MGIAQTVAEVVQECGFATSGISGNDGESAAGDEVGELCERLLAQGIQIGLFRWPSEGWVGQAEEGLCGFMHGSGLR